MENSNFHDTEIIEVSKEFHPICDYDSHRPFLWLALNLFPKENLTPFSNLGVGMVPHWLLMNFAKNKGDYFLVMKQIKNGLKNLIT